MAVVVCSIIMAVGNSFQLLSFYQATMVNVVLTIAETTLYECGLYALIFTRSGGNVAVGQKKNTVSSGSHVKRLTPIDASVDAETAGVRTRRNARKTAF
jgi:hypothetical protein